MQPSPVHPPTVECIVVLLVTVFTVSLQVPSEEEYYQQEEFTHKRKPTSTANKSKPMPPEHSLFIFSPTNLLRQKCHWLCNHSYFGNVVLLCIMVSSAMLAAEDPLNSQSPRNNVSRIKDSVF